MVQRVLTGDVPVQPVQPPADGLPHRHAHHASGRRGGHVGSRRRHHAATKNAGSTLPLSATNGGTIAVIGPSASVSPTYAGGGSAYVIPSSTVTPPTVGIQAAAGSGTNVTYSQGLPADASLPAIPSSNLSPAYSSTPSGGSYTGTLTAPTTGTYVLAITNPCNCYTPTYLSLNGQQIIDDPSTPPVHTYSVAVSLTAGQTYKLSISGQSSQLLWGTPTALAPSISAAVTAAQSASAAVVVVSDDTESEAADRPSLNLPSAQDELISAVAAANPHTIVVIDAGAPVAMPWLSQVAGVLDAWYPGQTSGTSLASVLFGQTNPSGHLPVTFPASLSQMPTSSPAQFPGNGSTVQYSEGIDVGYRGYDAGNLTPLFPFGFGLSYMRRSRSATCRSQPGQRERHADRAGDRDGHQHRHARGKRRRAAVPGGSVRRGRAAASALRRSSSEVSLGVEPVDARCRSPSRRCWSPGGTTLPTAGVRPRAPTTSMWATPRTRPACRCRARTPWRPPQPPAERPRSPLPPP